MKPSNREAFGAAVAAGLAHADVTTRGLRKLPKRQRGLVHRVAFMAFMSGAGWHRFYQQQKAKRKR